MNNTNKTDLILQQNVYAIHYTEMDKYLRKKLKSYTGKETFVSIEVANRFLTKNGFKPFEGMKFDQELNVGSLTTYAVVKQFELYSY